MSASAASRQHGGARDLRPIEALTEEEARDELASLAEQIQHPMCARVRHLFLAPDTQPLATEDALLLEGKYLLRSIPTRGQGRLQAGHRCGQLVSTHALIACAPAVVA